jgi:Uncharacterised ArCR, COG2043.
MDDKLKEFLDALGYTETPMGMFYTDTEPEDGFVPKEGPAVTAELEQAGGAAFANWSCVMGKVWLARKKQTAAYFEARRYGCIGGSFYLGFHKPQLDLIAHYVSSGIPGALPGERYLPSAEASRRFFKEIDPRPAPAKFCVFKPVDQFRDGEMPEVVTFFARGEIIGGLCELAVFATEDFEVVASPFGAGCSYMVSWPLRYLAQGRPRAVLGGWDPSNRKFLKPDEATFSVPYGMYRLFLERWQDSFLTSDVWGGIKGRIAKSREVWGE